MGPCVRRDGTRSQTIAHTVLRARFVAMDFLSAITPQIAVLGIGALVTAVVTFVLVSLALRE
jgi:hypothetical protein